MEPRRHLLLIGFLLAIAACAAGGYLAPRLLGGGLPWQGMEALTGSQVIGSTVLTIEIEPASGKVVGEAVLGVSTAGGDGTQVALMLNRGLDIDRIVCEGQSLSHRRDGERILVQLPEGIHAGELTLTYSGALRSGNDAPLILREDEFVADRLQFWYPVDLKSFSTFAVTAIVPEDFEVAWSGTLLENQAAEGRRSVRWEESRPVLAAGFAAGRFKKVSRVQGSIRCNIFGRDLDEARAENWLADLGDSYNYFHAQFGADGFNQLNLVISDEAVGPSHLGGPTILCNPDRLENGDEAFALLAHQVARNWWGDTVSGRWFSTRPEAGEWLMTGLSEYSAWQALRTLKGRRAYLRHQESLYCPPEIPGPLKAYNLERRLHPSDGVDERVFTVRGPYTAAMLAEYIGADAFARASRNFMSVHRYSTVSYAALLHEMSLASEKPLDELVRVWFDRPGTFDYAIASVTEEGGRVHVTVKNAGDIPAYVPMELGLVTEEGYQAHSIAPGVHGDTLTFTLNEPLKRVVLDPEFALGDMRRTNNAWPATQWPGSLAVSRSGRIALLSESEWGGDQSHGLYFFSLAGRAPDVAINIAGAAPSGLTWDSAGRQLVVQREGALGVWRENQWHPAGGDDALFLGWGARGPILWDEGRIAEMGETVSDKPVLSPKPIPGLSDVQASTGRVAYVTEAHVLVMWEPSAQALSAVREAVRPAGSLRWRGETNEIMYFETEGALVSVAPDHAAQTTLLRRNYPIKQAKISERGGRVAWVDPAGLLRALTPGSGEPVYISLPGEVVDFAWEGEDALIAIVATIPRRLPMRFHADYSLWRIPATTWRGLQLPYNPMDFAKAASGMTALRQP